MKVVKTKTGHAIERQDGMVSVCEWLNEYDAIRECARLNKINNEKYEDAALNNGVFSLRKNYITI